MMVSRMKSVLPLARGITTSVEVQQRAMEMEDGAEGLRPATAQMGTMMDMGARSIFTTQSGTCSGSRSECG